MKKIFLTLVLLLSIATSATAQVGVKAVVIDAPSHPRAVIVAPARPVIIKRKAIKHKHKHHPHKRRIKSKKIGHGARPLMIRHPHK